MEGEEIEAGVVCLEIRLPEMAGLEVLRDPRAQAVTCDIPVFILSNCGEDALAARVYVSALTSISLRDGVRARRSQPALTSGKADELSESGDRSTEQVPRD